MTIIIDHTSAAWLRKQERLGNNKHNGALYYSQEIVDNIIPNVKTDRNWITVNVEGHGCDHAIVFVHSNLRPDHYEWLSRHNDLILVCGVPETCDKVKHLGKAIYLPLSIDTEYVKQFKQPKSKRKGVAFAGRSAKKKYPGVTLPYNIRCLSGMARDELLTELAQLEKVYAVGRIAVEAKALGVEVLPYDPRYPDPDRWKVLDNRKAAKMLQEKLDAIDGQYQTIIDHTHPVYIEQRNKLGKSRWNGAYYYSVEVVEKIIPNVITDRPWITINIKDPKLGADRAIVFVHNHKQCPQCYEWLRGYKDLIFICSERDDMPKLEHLGTPIYLPLSVDVEFVKRFRKSEKTKGTAFVGRRERARDIADKIPAGTEYVSGLPRKELLTKLADYETVYALDRVAIEAQILGCKVLPFPDRWKVIDSKEAAETLQGLLDKVDKKEGVSFGGAQTEGVSLAANADQEKAPAEKDGGKKEGVSFREGTPDGVRAEGETGAGRQTGRQPGQHPSEITTEQELQGGDKMKKENQSETDWRDGFPERNGIYKCRINGEDIRPLMHKRCTINNRSRWMELDGHDAIGDIQFEDRRLGIEEL